MKIGLFGYGKMGKVVAQLATAQGHTIAEVQEADVCIDFSHADGVMQHITWAIAHQKPLVIGTTGWYSELERAKEMVKKSTIAALFSANFSIGVALFIQILKQARALFLDYEIAGVEYHHNQKKDAPSGTALNIAQALEMTTPFASVRCGKITGKHEVIFDSLADSVTITHEAHNREGFASGALKAAEWIQNKKGWYTFDDLLRSVYSADNTV